MAGPIRFNTDDEVIEALCRPFGLAYLVCQIGTTLERARPLRDANKVKIVKARVEVHKQTATQIAFQLELLDKLDSLKQYIDKTYGDSHAKD